MAISKRITSEDLTLNLILNIDRVHSENTKLLGELYKLDRQTRDLEIKYARLQVEKKNLSKTTEGYTNRVAQLNRELTKTRNQIEANRAQMNEWRKQIGVAALTINQLRSHLSVLKIQRDNATDPSTIKTLNKEIGHVNARIERMTTGMSRAAQAWRNLGNAANKFGTITGWIMISLYAVGSAISRTTRNFRELDKTYSNVMKSTDLTRQEVQRLKRDFDQLNEADAIKTPTSTNQLLEIARIAGRLGVRGVNDIRDFTLAVDKLYVALGEDLEGSVEEVAEKVGKLVNVFNLTKDMPLGEAMLRAGSLINELGKRSAASAETVLNYTARLGGVGSMAKFTIDQLAGLGAALDAMNVPAERGSTALVKLITSLGTNVDQFSRLLGITKEEYAEWVNRDINRLLLKMLEVSSQGNSSIMEVVEGMDAMDVSGVRVAEVFGKLTQNMQMVIEQQAIAKTAFESSASVMNEFYIMSKDYDSLMAIQGKRLKSLADEYSKSLSPAMYKIYRGFIDVLYALKDFALWIGRNIGLITGLAAAIGVLRAARLSKIITEAWITLKLWTGDLIRSIKFAWANNASLIAMRAAYINAGGSIKGATAALRAFGLAMANNPLTAIIAVALAGAAALLLFKKRTNEALKAMNEMGTEIAIQSNAMRHMFEAAKKTVDNTTARANAIKTINEVYGEYLPNLLTEKSSVQEIGTAYEIANRQLREKIALSYQNEKFNKIIEKSSEERINKQERMLGGLQKSQGPLAYGQAMFETSEVVDRLAKMTDKTAIGLTVTGFLKKWGLENQASREAFLDMIELRKEEIKLEESFDKMVQGYMQASQKTGDGTGGGGGTGWKAMTDDEFEGSKKALETWLKQQKTMLLDSGKDKEEINKSELAAEYAYLQKLLALTKQKYANEKGEVIGGESEIADIEYQMAQNRQARREANLKEEKADSKTIIDIEKVRYEAIADERNKDIAEEEYRHKKQIKEYEQSTSDKATIEEAIELETRQHKNRLNEIELKYLDQSLADTNVNYAQRVMLLEADYKAELITTEQYYIRKRALELEFNDDLLSFKRRYGVLVEDTLDAEIDMYKKSQFYALLTEEEKQKGIQYITDKYQNKREKQYKSNIDKEIETIRAKFNDLQNEAYEQGMSTLSVWQDVGSGIGDAFSAMFDKTQDGFSAFAKQLVLLAIDTAQMLVRMEYPVILAKKLSKYAAVPGGTAIALSEYGVTIALIEAAFGVAKAAVSTLWDTDKKETQQYATGRYPVLGESGRTYQAEWVGKPKTGIYKRTSFGLFSEDKPEMVIDYPTLRNIQINSPGLIKAIMAHKTGYGAVYNPSGETKKYKNGNYKTEETTQQQTVYVIDVDKFDKAVSRLETLKWNLSIQKFEKLKNDYDNMMKSSKM